jgi:hypothetical protein
MATGSESISEGTLEPEMNVMTYRSETDGCSYSFSRDCERSRSRRVGSHE